MQTIALAQMPNVALPPGPRVTEKSVSLTIAGLLALAAVCIGFVRTPPAHVADAPVAPIAAGHTITALR